MVTWSGKRNGASEEREEREKAEAQQPGGGGGTEQERRKELVGAKPWGAGGKEDRRGMLQQRSLALCALGTPNTKAGPRCSPGWEVNDVKWAVRVG